MKKMFNCISIVIFLGLPSLGFSLPIERIKLKPATFSELPGWNNGNEFKQSFVSFKKSCQSILKLKSSASVGSDFFNLTAKDFYPACKAAQAIKKPTTKKSKKFFSTWFKPAFLTQSKLLPGKFTSYYVPTIKGSLNKTSKYTVPIYGVPSDLITVNSKSSLKGAQKVQVGRKVNNKIIPYYTRKEINNGAIKNKAPILAWVENPLDRMTLGIEGSGVIELPNHKKIYLNYATTNGRSSILLPKLLENLGIMKRKEASINKIKAYFLKNPKQLTPILNQGESFVFFTRTKQEDAFGSLHTPLTPGYSIAIDPKWVPFGLPVWLDTKKPNQGKSSTSLRRLMIAQDTGSAILGPVRADLFWGSGKEATYLAQHMDAPGKYWLFIPKHLHGRLAKQS